MSGLGIVEHELVGARFLLERGCSLRIAQLVAGHVQAKRYLCWSKRSYFSKLSEASRQTLNFQGGPMTQEEAHEFQRSPHFKDILRLRVWDERAKVPSGPQLSLQKIGILLDEHIGQQEQSNAT